MGKLIKLEYYRVSYILILKYYLNILVELKLKDCKGNIDSLLMFDIIY